MGLALNIPSQELTEEKSLHPTPVKIKHWLGELHVTDLEKSLQQILDVLKAYNRCQLEPSLRFNSLLYMLPTLREISEQYQEKYVGKYYVNNEKYRARAQLLISLLEEIANGFKIYLADSVELEKHSRDDQKDMLSATYFAVNWLANNILMHYTLYREEPHNSWLDLHRLYDFAEQNNWAAVPVEARRAGDVVDRNISNSYKRVLLLSLSNPYHLMQGEAMMVYKHFRNWVGHCKISEVLPDAATGNFVVDLDSDDPPFFNHSNFPKKLSRPRLIDIDRVARTAAAFYQKLVKKSVSGVAKGANGMRERMERELFSRLQDAWKGRMQRKENRTGGNWNIIMAEGLVCSHHFISGEREFLPERDELRFYRPEMNEHSMSLIPQNTSPWQVAEAIDRIETGVVSNRSSHFDSGDPAFDIWDQTNANRVRADEVKEQSEPEFVSQLWQTFNESHGGVGLSNHYSARRHARVGDIVVFKHDDENDDSIEGWNVGVIRWLMEKMSDQVEMGISTLAVGAVCAAVRAVCGVGKGSEYFRSLILFEKIGGKEIPLLLVPAAIYEIGTILVLNLGDEVKYIRLEKLHETTPSFSSFQFKYIDPPDVELTHIAKMRGEV